MYRLTTVKTIAGQDLSVPMITCESRPTALKRFEAAIKDAERELNEGAVRLVGGRVELTLEECAYLIGGGSDVIARATVKRPVNSPRAEVFRV